MDFCGRLATDCNQPAARGLRFINQSAVEFSSKIFGFPAAAPAYSGATKVRTYATNAARRPSASTTGTIAISRRRRWKNGCAESDNRQTQSSQRSKPGKDVKGGRDGDPGGPTDLGNANEALKSKRNVTWKPSGFSLPIHPATESRNGVEQPVEQEEDAENRL